MENIQTEIRVFGTKFGIFEVLKYKTVDAFLDRHLPFLHEMPDFKGTQDERENELRELYALCGALAAPPERETKEEAKTQEHDNIPGDVQKGSGNEPKQGRNRRSNRTNSE